MATETKELTDDQRIVAAMDLVEKARKTVADILSFYGTNLQVYGWHLNGAAEPWDSFFENNDTQSAIDNLDAAFEHLSSIPDREGQDFEAADDTEVTRVLRLMCGMATTTDIYAALVPRILADAGYQIVKAQTNQA